MNRAGIEPANSWLSDSLLDSRCGLSHRYSLSVSHHPRRRSTPHDYPHAATGRKEHSRECLLDYRVGFACRTGSILGPPCGFVGNAGPSSIFWTCSASNVLVSTVRPSCNALGWIVIRRQPFSHSVMATIVPLNPLIRSLALSPSFKLSSRTNIKTPFQKKRKTAPKLQPRK
jgi:hypothetical protein